MEKKSVKKMMVEKEVVETIICDICEKDIKENGEDIYFAVHTYHHRWGNDSIDSNKHFDLCSRNCLDIHYGAYFDNAEYSDSYDIEVEETKTIGE